VLLPLVTLQQSSWLTQLMNVLIIMFRYEPSFQFELFIINGFTHVIGSFQRCGFGFDLAFSLGSLKQ
jgi:hypothetical protein